MTDQRIPTGVPGFDEVLLGGLIPRHNYLIVGEVASGKTIFSLQWLLDGRRRNERGLYIALIEPLDSVERNASSFGWRLDGIDTADLTLVGQQAEPSVG